MKVLIDEQLPEELHLRLGNHEAATVAYMHWKGIRNGKLLKLAAEAGFDVLVTNDSGMPFEQHLTTLPCSIVVLQAKSNSIKNIAPQLPGLMKILSDLPPRTVKFVPRFGA